MNSVVSYCEGQVRAHDYDRYLISMLLPADVRADVWPVLAFNHEIAKTREVVSESTLGLIRLQWWRESVGEIYAGGAVKEHEVLKPLSEVIRRHDLPREAFDALLYAREFDLEDVLPGNIGGLLNYADFTTTPLFQLVVQVMGHDPAQEVIQPVAVNYALAGILRSTQVYAKQRRYYLPEDLVDLYSLDLEKIHEDEGLRQVIRDVVAGRLDPCRPRNLFLKGCEAMSEMYFSQIRGLDYDVMSPQMRLEPPFKVLRLFWKTKGLSFW